MDKFITKKRSFIIFPIIMLTSSMFAWTASKYTGIIMLIGLMITSTARFIILEGYINEEFSSSHRATALSSLNMFTSFIYMIIVYIGGQFMNEHNTGSIITTVGILTTIVLIPLSYMLVTHYEAHERSLTRR